MEYASEMNGMEIAIIGMAVRFPQSRTLHEFWHNIVQGKECVTFFSEEELLAEGVEQSTLDNPAYVRAKPYIEGICDFDAAFFGYSHKEEELMLHFSVTVTKRRRLWIRNPAYYMKLPTMRWKMPTMRWKMQAMPNVPAI